MLASPIVAISLILEGGQKRCESFVGVVDAAVPLAEATEGLEL